MEINWIFVCIIMLSVFSCSKPNDYANLERSWIQINQRHTSEGNFIKVLNGALISFSKDSVLTSLISNEKMVKDHYYIIDSTIYIDTLKFAKITHLNGDSLILEDEEGNYDLVFKALNKAYKIHPTALSERILFNNNWSFFNNDIKYTLFLDSVEYLPKDTGNLKKLGILKIEQDSFEYFSDYDWWSLKQFNNNLILGFSSGSNFIHTIQIKNINENYIDGYYIYPNDGVEIRLIPNEIENTIQLKELIGEWQIEEIIKPSKDQFKLIFDSLNNAEKNFYSIRKEKTPFQDLINGKLIFSFLNNFEYEIKTLKNVKIKQGKWRISPKNNLIYLDYLVDANNIIEITNQDKNSMTIEMYLDIQTTQSLKIMFKN